MQCQQTANVDCFKHAERDMKPKHDFRPHNMLYGTFLHVMTTRYQIMAHVIFNMTEEMVIKERLQVNVFISIQCYLQLNELKISM